MSDSVYPHYVLVGHSISDKFIFVEAVLERKYLKFSLTPEEVNKIEHLNNRNYLNEFLKKMIADSQIWAWKDKSDIQIISVKKGWM